MNLRPSGYEPDELPDCSTPRYEINGWRWIRTTEAICSRFTVCPLWPLGNPSIKADDRTRTDNLLITNQLLCQLSHIGLAVKLSGWRRIRTFESVANRFTVCPLWPLGNPSLNRNLLYMKQTKNARTFFTKIKIISV